MTVLHTIRLRGAWSVGAATEAGLKLHERAFGKPRTLDPDESIWLKHETSVPIRVIFNSQTIGELNSETSAIDLTTLIQPRNRLMLVVPDNVIIDSLILEIRKQG